MSHQKGTRQRIPQSTLLDPILPSPQSPTFSVQCTSGILPLHEHPRYSHLKIYLSNSYIDPAFLASNEYDWNPSTRKSTIPPGQLWDAVTIPVIELREGALDPSEVHADTDAPNTTHDEPAPSELVRHSRLPVAGSNADYRCAVQFV